jgi:hypothetical protein
MERAGLCEKGIEIGATAGVPAAARRGEKPKQSLQYSSVLEPFGKAISGAEALSRCE